MKTTIREITITMNMWGMSKTSIKRIVKKLESGKPHKFNNGMIFTIN